MLRKERAALDRAREMARREADRLESLQKKQPSSIEERSRSHYSTDDTECRKRNGLLPTKELLAKTSAKKRARTSTKPWFEVLRESSIRPTKRSSSRRISRTHEDSWNQLNKAGKVNTSH